VTKRSLDLYAWPSVPQALESYLAEALPVLRSDERILGVAVGGSFSSRQVDECSDSDLPLGVELETWPDILQSRSKLAKQLGSSLASFCGERVGEPRLE
jgi:predicted nucleotidyltransferase